MGAGMRAGLKRSYFWINQDMLDTINRPEWRTLLYVMCFCHSTVIERKKFGPLGWAIPYEFNQPDLAACVKFIQNHMQQMESKKNAALSWYTVKYMISEVQYGGRITDDLDRVTMLTYANKFFNAGVLDPNFKFFDGYNIPTGTDINAFRNYIESLPLVDNPELFGLHSNADITFRNKQTNELLTTIIDTQPKTSGGAGGLTREEVAVKIADDLLAKMPPEYNLVIVQEKIAKQGGLKMPLNICLKQEIERIQKVIKLVGRTLKNLKLAVAGTIILSEDLVEAINCLYDATVPGRWKKISWASPLIGLWFQSFLERVGQLTKWLDNGRPYAFWLTGFFNPQGFLTAARQEVARKHQGWALDGVLQYTEVTKYDKEELKSGADEGVYIWGLQLDGAGWDKKGVRLVDPKPKQLFIQLPVILVSGVLEKEHRRDPSLYSCPTYMYPRRGTGATGTYVTQIDLPSGAKKPIDWTLRGVALLEQKD